MLLPHIAVRVESIRAERYSFDPVRMMQMNLSIMFSHGKKVDQRFTLGYVVKIDITPPIASISVKGTCTITPSSPEEAKELEKFFKEKKVPGNIVSFIYNYVMALISLLARELGLPTPCIPPTAQQRPKEFKGVEYHV
ncbi:MAG: hypothetical protein DRO12_04455 [Thermoprotei archaeon]|nr:MAG: hypothetical protein DRO12_04455 [Thermoprotei archaeon]